VAAEAFADRRYEADGSLRPRKFADALISDPVEAAEQALRIVEHGSVLAWDGAEISIDAQTICIHGDSINASKIAETTALTLREAGIRLGTVA
jgi:UPF0271 protein